jgi:phosphoribosylformimino-5-aminoimidazole carboxamide ribotide isomerase
VLTDVRRDGVSTGLDVSSAISVQESTGLQVVGSGGVTNLEDVRRAYEARLAGVIIGRALYDGKILLHEAIKQRGI